ncbi:hypothetical protein SCP_1204080 [Sparassis crispa]|uniref:Uncharacterized protein n=1 Tax=Sparassis crispa TaxID=139825 RepID=A0A401H169_9APHY|nr:hypothetical protein SCP_1204080 [Sparassis crispa]GBE88177.1 hypothetical protein SCP_1204080 [Sparassis crispa]
MYTTSKKSTCNQTESSSPESTNATSATKASTHARIPLYANARAMISVLDRVVSGFHPPSYEPPPPPSKSGAFGFATLAAGRSGSESVSASV